MQNIKEIEDYIVAHGDAEPKFLQRLDRATHLFTINPRMESGHLQGRILKMICRMVAPLSHFRIGDIHGLFGVVHG